MSTALTVDKAFQIFMKDCVNLPSDLVARARTSRDFLKEQIKSLPERSDGFPKCHTVRNIDFGSFARRTKKRELNDIDMMVCFSAQGATYDQHSKYIALSNDGECPVLSTLTHDESSQLNSRKLIEKIKAELSKVARYEQAEIHRNQEAVTVKLKSYPWNFDVVPCFFTTEEADGRTYYLIPDGNGHWKKTDPRLDRERVSEVNKSSEGDVLGLIRLVKFWNSRPTMPLIPSYLLENIILDYCGSSPSNLCNYIDINFISILSEIKSAIAGSVMDPKNIQGDLNKLSEEDKKKIRLRIDVDLIKARNARSFEEKDEMEKAIKGWGKVFGDQFPVYG